MSKKDRPNPDSPFGALKGLKGRLAEEDAKTKAETERRKAQEAARSKAQTTAVAGKARDEDLFRMAMEGVTPLAGGAPARPRPKPGKVSLAAGVAAPAAALSDDEEVLNELQGMIDGTVPLDFTDSDEFVEGRAADCSRLDLAKLRRGELSVQAEVDLHGMGREEARAAVEEFFSSCLARGFRCVNVICGRGLHSEGGKPVLKDLLVRWFARGRMSYNILAFSSAKRHDGGVGAIYVLLRRRRAK